MPKKIMLFQMQVIKKKFRTSELPLSTVVVQYKDN